MKKPRKKTTDAKNAEDAGVYPKRGKLSLYPLSVEDAVRAAAQTGPLVGKPKRKVRK